MFGNLEVQKLSDIYKEKISALYYYWDQLEQIKLLSSDDFKKAKQEIRKYINIVLRVGVEEDFNGAKVIRRVMNAKEIKKQILLQFDKTVEKANLYFHINEMEKLGIIQVVDAIPEPGKKRFTSYYGRTAKIFLLDVDEVKHEHDIIFSESFSKLIMSLNPKLPINLLDDTLQKMERLKVLQNAKIVEWLQENDDTLNTLDIDLTKLFNLLSYIQRYDSNVFDGISELKKYLKI